MKLRIRVFALAKQLAGSDSVLVSVREPATVRDVRCGLAESCPAIAGLGNQMLIAVDSEYADDSTAVTAKSDVACIPPVSGG